jgi:flavin reductase (DIM6/NTAB) family NADH-FMN oxidoreductase RutF
VGQSLTESRPETAPEQPDFTQHDFRTLMSGFPPGVAIVTTIDASGVPMGMTCSAVCSVSLSPPVLLVCLRNESPTLAMISQQLAFSVNLLQDTARPVSDLFASGAPDRFDRVRWQTDEQAGGPHLVADAHSIADCTVRTIQRVGDHEVVIGEVTRITCRRSRRPLMYGLRRYAVWPPEDAEQPHPAEVTVTPAR